MTATTSAVCFFTALTLFSQVQPPPSSDDLRRRAQIIRPAASELKWQRIPWITDLAEGHRQAQAERRPIFLWVTGDDPLERC